MPSGDSPGRTRATVRANGHGLFTTLPAAVPVGGSPTGAGGSPAPPIFKTGSKRARAAFTLAEVLAALAFMAIVIPVAVEGLRIANLAGEVGQRKMVAARIAERVLNESIIGSRMQGTAQSGTIQEGMVQYRWSIRSEPWSEATMNLVTVRVIYPAQGHDYDVRLSTLVNTSSTL